MARRLACRVAIGCGRNFCVGQNAKLIKMDEWTYIPAPAAALLDAIERRRDAVTGRQPFGLAAGASDGVPDEQAR